MEFRVHPEFPIFSFHDHGMPLNDMEFFMEWHGIPHGVSWNATE
jgi:hypothetical protein